VATAATAAPRARDPEHLAREGRCDEGMRDVVDEDQRRARGPQRGQHRAAVRGQHGGRRAPKERVELGIARFPEGVGASSGTLVVRLPELVAHAHRVEATGGGAPGKPAKPLLADQPVADVDREGPGQVAPKVLEVSGRGHHQDVRAERHDGPAIAREDGDGTVAQGVAHRDQDGSVEGKTREERDPDHSTSRVRGA
jgi:hypothetical protein